MTKMPCPNQKLKTNNKQSLVRGLNPLNYPLQHKCLVKERLITYKSTLKPH